MVPWSVGVWFPNVHFQGKFQVMTTNMFISVKRIHIYLWISTVQWGGDSPHLRWVKLVEQVSGVSGVSKHKKRRTKWPVENEIVCVCVHYSSSPFPPFSKRILARVTCFRSSMSVHQLLRINHIQFPNSFFFEKQGGCIKLETMNYIVSF